MAGTGTEAFRKWVSIYKNDAPCGLLDQQSNKYYPPESKIKSVLDYLSGKYSLKMRNGYDPAEKDGHPYAKRICIHCGEEFWPAGPNTKTCSEACSHQHGIDKMREWRAAQKTDAQSEEVAV